METVAQRHSRRQEPAATGFALVTPRTDDREPRRSRDLDADCGAEGFHRLAKLRIVRCSDSGQFYSNLLCLSSILDCVAEISSYER
jgi:hypothetical protein